MAPSVACDRVCQHGVMGIREEFGSINDMRLDSGVCLHICSDVSITAAATHKHTHIHTAPVHTVLSSIILP